MMTTIEALQELYIALGGQAETVANITLIPDMIHAIAELKASDNQTDGNAANDGK